VLLLLEKLKSILLACLILSSMFLTYRLWFGRPPLEKGSSPYYEYAYFTPAPQPSAIVQPSDIIFSEGEEIYLFYRGEKQYVDLWEKGLQLIGDRLEVEMATHTAKESITERLKTAPATLVYNFNPPVPLEYLVTGSANWYMNIEKIIFIWEKEQLDVFLEGEDLLCITVPGVEYSQEDFLPAKKKPYMRLPSLLALDFGSQATGAEPDNTGEASTVSEVEGEKTPSEAIEEVPEELAFLTEMEINVASDIYLPLEDIWAAEVTLKKEEFQQEKLVRAFFLDLSMARRIEERDGALYFTNGEKGLRIYPSGLLEYTAPSQERRHSDISYSVALQKGAESHSLYGGWMPDIYLSEAEEVKGGYRFIWRAFLDGFVLEGGDIGIEILINEQGVSSYRRMCYVFGEELAGRKPFCSYTEALAQALLLKKDRLTKNKVTLLSLKPVYYLLQGENIEKAVPAWHINFAETGDIYLHWNTLEPLI
jgi:regulatory protein YycH of two-component signal transduction system YycFG